jgi:hypothetical protein
MLFSVLTTIFTSKISRFDQQTNWKHNAVQAGDLGSAPLLLASAASRVSIPHPVLWPLHEPTRRYFFATLVSCHQDFDFRQDDFDVISSLAVDAINELYASLGSPDLHGWASSGGDPCMEAWQGVQCLGPNITAM